MNLADARSYFSAEFEERLTTSEELEAELLKLAGEPSFIHQAAVELGGLTRARRQAGRMTRAARYLSGRDFIEAVWQAGGSISYGALVHTVRRRHKMAGTRNERVLRELERADVLMTTTVTTEWGVEVRVTFGPELEAIRWGTEELKAELEFGLMEVS